MTQVFDDSSVQAVLQPIAEEGVDQQEHQLALWLIRDQFDVSAPESYEFVELGQRVFEDVVLDGAFAVAYRDVVSPVYLVVGRQAAHLAARVERLVAALRAEEEPERQLSLRNLRLRSALELARTREVELQRVVVVVCTADLTPAAKRKIKEAADGYAAVRVFDARLIVELARAEREPTRARPNVTIAAPATEVLDLPLASGRGLLVAIDAAAVAEWPGIEDRSLFDLNVRTSLGVNKVRRSLEASLTDSEAAGDFIAYHNGITAICTRFEVSDSSIDVEGLSVVNGAQTVSAIFANRDRLAHGIRLVLKLIEASSDSDLASLIAVRSNTQNPVTSRNLRALDDVQQRLRRELRSHGYAYLTRPADRPLSGEVVINNDDVAQLLCSMYVRRPAVAVKRQVLFDNANYRDVFPEDLPADRVIFAFETRQVVESLRDEVPTPFGRAWALTALTLFYMTAEALRSTRQGSQVLDDPSMLNRHEYQSFVRPYALSALHALGAYAGGVSDDDDDFKVAFKQTRTLADLGNQAAKTHRGLSREAEG